MNARRMHNRSAWCWRHCWPPPPAAPCGGHRLLYGRHSAADLPSSTSRHAAELGHRRRSARPSTRRGFPDSRALLPDHFDCPPFPRAAHRQGGAARAGGPHGRLIRPSSSGVGGGWGVGVCWDVRFKEPPPCEMACGRAGPGLTARFKPTPSSASPGVCRFRSVPPTSPSGMPEPARTRAGMMLVRGFPASGSPCAALLECGAAVDLRHLRTGGTPGPAAVERSPLVLRGGRLHTDEGCLARRPRAFHGSAPATDKWVAGIRDP